MSETIKVGDVVAWADVPDGALVRQGIYAGRAPEFYFVARRGNDSLLCGVTIPLDGISEWYQARPAAPWRSTFSPNAEPPRVTVLALGLTGQETADDLRRLAEVFEVREALRADDQLSLLMEADGVVRIDHIEDEQTQADRLHAAGWRPGMTAEDAARMLAAEEAK